MDDATQGLLKVLRAHFEDSHELAVAWDEAPRVALMHLSRPGWPAEFLDKDRKAPIQMELQKLANRLLHKNDMSSLLEFAQSAVRLVLKQIPWKGDSEFERERLESFIRAEQFHGHDEQTAVARAAVRFFNYKKERRVGKFYVPADPSNRLLEILSLPKSMGAELPKQDIRALLLKSSLADLLKKAVGFSPETLRSVLGETLSRQLKPVGFADSAHRIVLIQVSSSSVAHEMLFQKPDILRRLKRLPEFEQVTDIRFSVVY